MVEREARPGPSIKEWTSWLNSASPGDMRRELIRLYSAHNEDIEGDLACKIMSYDDSHLDAEELGYESLTEALEDLERLKVRAPNPDPSNG